MSGYSFPEYRHILYTDDGADTLYQIRQNVEKLLNEAGAFTAGKAFCSGDSWTMLAALDRMVELGEIVEVTKPNECWAQHRVFTKLHWVRVRGESMSNEPIVILPRMLPEPTK